MCRETVLRTVDTDLPGHWFINKWCDGVNLNYSNNKVHTCAKLWMDHETVGLNAMVPPALLYKSTARLKDTNWVFEVVLRLFALLLAHLVSLFRQTLGPRSPLTRGPRGPCVRPVHSVLF